MKITFKSTNGGNLASNTTGNNTVKLKNIFGEEDDESGKDSSVGKHLLVKKKHLINPAPLVDTTSSKPSFEKSTKLSTEGLAPELYQYDEYVDDSRRGNEDSKNLKYLGYVSEDKTHERVSGDDVQTNTKESQYMKKLISTARRRQIDRDIALEKQILKEDLESNNEQVSEAFITGAYKRKLEERKQYELEQKKQDEYDALHSNNSVAKLHSYMLKAGLAKRSNVK